MRTGLRSKGASLQEREMWSEGRKKRLLPPPLFPVPLTAGENTHTGVQDLTPQWTPPAPPVPPGQPGQAART